MISRFVKKQVFWSFIVSDVVLQFLILRFSSRAFSLKSLPPEHIQKPIALNYTHDDNKVSKKLSWDKRDLII